MILNPKIPINGKGDSLWGESAGNFYIERIELNYWNVDHGEIQCFGRSTEWFHYTDSLIEKEVNIKLITFIRELLKNEQEQNIIYEDIDYNLDWELGWSKQGMQPDNGWSFDLFIK